MGSPGGARGRAGAGAEPGAGPGTGSREFFPASPEVQRGLLCSGGRRGGAEGARVALQPTRPGQRFTGREGNSWPSLTKGNDFGGRPPAPAKLRQVR